MIDWILVLNVAMGVALYNIVGSAAIIMSGVVVDTWKNNRFN